MINKESNIDGKTVSLLKHAFKTIGNKFSNIIKQSLDQADFPDSALEATISPDSALEGEGKENPSNTKAPVSRTDLFLPLGSFLSFNCTLVEYSLIELLASSSGLFD